MLKNRENAALHVAQGLKLLRLESLKVVIAVNVAPRVTFERFRSMRDRVVCLLTTDYLDSVSQYNGDFTQVEDDEMVRMLCASSTAQLPTGFREHKRRKG